MPEPSGFGFNETAGASTAESTRTGEKWSDFSQLTSLTVGGKTYPGEYGSTDNGERLRLGDTYYHPGPIGLAAETTAGVDTGFALEPEGTLNSMTREGKAYYYLTDALGSVIGLADEAGTKVNTYAYSPRGVTRTTATTEQIAQPYRFAGGHHDPTGLFSFGDFLKDTIGGALVGAAGGCVAGAVGSIWTGPGALAGCGIGAATGGAGGLVTGAGTYLWNDLT